MIFKRLLLVLAVAIHALALRAGEGMWLPLLLNDLNETEMRSLGMKMTAEDIYSVNSGSLKDAIVHFGGFCTGEVISDQGLILTNHHCGFGQIQSHSTVEKNYLDDGFWAKTQADELANPGLFVTFIVRIEDVTTDALAGVTDQMTEKERQHTIDQNLNTIRKNAVREDYQDVMVKPFYLGNQYFLFVTETYKDVRLVGAPPSSIGKFGADTDNWVWPRHTGDFSLFRIYANAENKPADYSADNVPFKPKHALPISLDGVETGDFTLVFGFPGNTDEYLPASAVAQRVQVLNPVRIGIRDKTLAIYGEAMRNDPKAKIQYASKQSRIANAWKKWIGESEGIEKTGGIDRKRALEAEFIKRVNGNAEWKKQYGKLLEEMNSLYAKIEPYAKTRDYVSEIGVRNVELLREANSLYRYVRAYEASGMNGVTARIPAITQSLEEFHKDYQPEIDKKVFAALMEVYFAEVPLAHISDYLVQEWSTNGKNAGKWADAIFQKSMLARPEAALELIRTNPEKFFKELSKDYSYRIARSMTEANDEKVMIAYNEIQPRINVLQRQYMRALMEVFPEKRFYPDANGTMRVTYGQVDGYQPRNGVKFLPTTELAGVMEKYVPGDYEFDVPEKLRELFAAKDYGPYGEDGKMPVCFLGTNHTTGGNSGSPAIDAHGNLIGLNFDRVWEGTMSDILFDPSICRNIMVDIRYVLFIIDKFAGAGHLVQEMNLVHPKAVDGGG